MSTTDPEVPPATVRDAAPADLPAVRQLVTEAGLPLDGLEDAGHVLVAQAGDVVVGTVALERYGDEGAPVFLLRSAAVDPAWRGRGLGAALTGAALARVDADRAEVALLTETAAGYFPRFGFRLVDRAALPTGLAASAELRGACPESAHALLRPVAGHAR